LNKITLLLNFHLKATIPVLDESHDDLEGVGENGVAIVTSLDSLDEDVSATSLYSQTHGVLKHPVVKAALEHLEKNVF
jgi:hypothetical protein